MTGLSPRAIGAVGSALPSHGRGHRFESGIAHRTLLAAEVFATEPVSTGSRRLDAGFAALADHLAERDGWEVPVWALDPARRTDGWFPAVPAIFRSEAEQESPRAFRNRGIFITGRSLGRA